MSGNDAELEQLRAVSCSALLERLPPPWQLDKAESTKGCLKYRRGKGEIILVTHEGRGWWDPGSTTARGDVFHLVQHLQPGTNFGQVRKLLREFVGISPSYPAHERTREREPRPCRCSSAGPSAGPCGEARRPGPTSRGSGGSRPWW